MTLVLKCFCKYFNVEMKNMAEIKSFLRRIMPSKLWRFFRFCYAFLSGNFVGSVVPVCLWPKKEFRKMVMERYEKEMGYRFNLNHPVLFTEKVQWYKTCYNMSKIPRITDKVRFKKYIEQRLGKEYVIPLYGHWYTVNGFLRDWDQLPQEFVLKSNLSGDDYGVKVIHEKSKININELKEELYRWLEPLNTCLNSLDFRAYYSFPQILAERFIHGDGADFLTDYKFFCFNGEPYCAYIDNRWGGTITFYDLNFRKLNVQYAHFPNGIDKQPIHWNQMIEVARKLSKGFPMVRVDFYDTNEQLYVGEMTFTPGSGCRPYYPESFNRTLGDLFVLPTVEQ